MAEKRGYLAYLKVVEAEKRAKLGVDYNDKQEAYLKLPEYKKLSEQDSKIRRRQNQIEHQADSRLQTEDKKKQKALDEVVAQIREAVAFGKENDHIQGLFQKLKRL